MVLATKSDNLSSSPRAPVVKKETYPKILPLSVCAHTYFLLGFLFVLFDFGFVVCFGGGRVGSFKFCFNFFPFKKRVVYPQELVIVSLNGSHAYRRVCVKAPTCWCSCAELGSSWDLHALESRFNDLPWEDLLSMTRNNRKLRFSDSSSSWD